MARPLVPPKYGLVLWPDARDPTLPSCLPIDWLADALAKGATLIAIEDAELCGFVTVFNPPKVINDPRDPA